MSRLSQLLLLLVALAALTFAAAQGVGLPAQQVLLLLLGGALAQGFASWRPREPEFRGMGRPNRIGSLLSWLLRALIGSLLLAFALWAALRELPPLLPAGLF